MGWRSEYTRILERDDANGLTYANLKRVETALLTMPMADRIVLARELLEGTGRVVARDVGEMQTPGDRWDDAAWARQESHNACRAAMLADDDGDE